MPVKTNFVPDENVKEIPASGWFQLQVCTCSTDFFTWSAHVFREMAQIQRLTLTIRILSGAAPPTKQVFAGFHTLGAWVQVRVLWD